MERTLFLLDSLTAIGGSERKAVRIVNELSKRGHGIFIGYLNPPETLIGDISSEINVQHLDRKGKFDFNVLKKIKTIIDENHLDNIVCMNLYTSLYGSLTKTIYSNIDIRFIMLINTNNFVPASLELKMLIYRPFFAKASKLIFGCRNQQMRWVKRYFIDQSRCTYIYNGVDCSYFSPQNFSFKRQELRRGLGFKENEIVIVNVASFLPKKNQNDLIEACAKLLAEGHQVRLALVGDGPRRDTLEAHARRLGIYDRVSFLGQLLDVRSVLCSADIFSLSSAAENFSNAALEAMAMGKPVVLSDVGGAPEMVKEGINGFLYPASDIDTLVKKLRILIEDASLRHETGLRARELVEKVFSFDKMISEYERLITASDANGP